MPDKALLEQIVEKVVTEVLNGYLPQMRADLTRRVLQEVQPHLGVVSESNTSSVNMAAGLMKAVSEIQSGTTQREILRSLLDGAAQYSGRSALFVIKGNSAVGWQGRSFNNADDIKDFPLDINSGVAARAMQSRAVARGISSEFDARFVSRFSRPADDQVLVLPLLLKEKVAALIYVDAGSNGNVDTSALELLVVAAGAWLEVVSLRKQSPKDGAADSIGIEKAVSAPAAPAPSHSDPFANHAPAHFAKTVEAPAQSIPEPPQPAFAASASVSGNGAAAAQAPDAFADLSPEDADIHRKAQRFARLLVDEIKLYNQAKVAEGRSHNDLYDRLREDIDKSHATYQKRFGNTVAARASYFNREVVRSLAEDDISLMGSNFQR